MAESREHRALVADLVRQMLARGITVRTADSPGWSRPSLVGLRRPDVFGFYRAGGTIVAGEAKRGPELWSSRTQLEQLADALPTTGPPGTQALLILAVPSEWELEAKEVCRSLHAPGTVPLVWPTDRT